MNNLIGIQSDVAVVRNGIVLWRNEKCLSDDDLFDEYKSLKEEIRRRKRNIH